MRTSFHHQPEAQHPKIFSYPQAAGRLPHLSGAFLTSDDAGGNGNLRKEAETE